MQHRHEHSALAPPIYMVYSPRPRLSKRLLAAPPMPLAAAPRPAPAP